MVKVQRIHEGKSMARRRNRVETAKKKRHTAVSSKKSEKFFRDAKAFVKGYDRAAIKREDRIVNVTLSFNEDGVDAKGMDKMSMQRKSYEARNSVNYDVERFGCDA